MLRPIDFYSYLTPHSHRCERIRHLLRLVFHKLGMRRTNLAFLAVSFMHRELPNVVCVMLAEPPDV